MASLSHQPLVSPQITKTFCRIVGFTCLAGFIVDLVVLALPPDPLQLEWRVSFLQQVSNRGIVLLFGLALTLYGFSGSRRGIRQISLLAMLLGLVFSLSCLLSIRDISLLQQQAINTINSQAAQLQTQIQAARTNPNPPANVTPEQLTQAAQEVVSQSETLKQNAKLSAIRTGFASVGNLFVTGLGLFTVGCYGLRMGRG